ncbi:hypothetical protein H7I77_17275 [Mycolicibacterium novocastrense]|uniref:NnrS family protein n=1 Tax=Mycolicibacterium novocastrense TaxID=59813 RepID=A0AAW5SM93_MYCNV|nr:hypothetical protein [Mycolicibacterium novocastrense]MCV7025076.1 hypothetical protein [Mycolicibacterium novocastrense]GAT09275.1 uncharacterized protein RMCN_2408 [Mycolicibacterium novocastrense]
MAENRIPPRALLLVPGAFALLAGLDAGLLRLGLPAPIDTARLADAHGMLLVLGFVGTVIAVERAVASGRRWCYLAPAFLGLGAVLLVSPAPRRVADLALLAGAALLAAVYVPLWRRSWDAAVLVQAAGAVLATGAALLWAAGLPVSDLLGWLAGFLILTIAGERLELARVAMLGTNAEVLLVASSTAVVLGALAQLLWPTVGFALLGGAVLGITCWLLRFDIARRTVHTTGLTRYMAVCLLAGYAWLAVPGLTWLVVGPVHSGGGYDAVVHAVMLGFVLSMIMAHAPVIMPAVLRRPVPYTPAMYGPVVLLHASLLLRVVVGDVRGVEWALQAGGVLNIVAVLAFAGVAVHAATRRRPIGVPA